jgi:subtilisin family serine protease
MRRNCEIIPLNNSTYSKLANMKKVLLTKLLALLVLFAAVLNGCKRESNSEVQPSPDGFSSRLITYSSDVIPGQYVVAMDEAYLPAGVRTAVAFEERQQIMKEEGRRMLERHAIPAEKIQYVYGVAFKGFSLTGLSDKEVQRLLADPAVKYMAQDLSVSLKGGPPVSASCATNNAEVTPCGIGLVKGGATYTGNRKAYIIDTGIDLDHPDLNVDVNGYNAFTKGKDAETLDDLNGHGTHVSGIVAAIKGNNKGVVGVAAGATVVPVKVLDSRGSGLMTGIIAGVNWVAGHATAGDVANMSLGGSYYLPLNTAVINASNNGIWFVVAAGNESRPASNYSPASANGPYVRTIAAMDCSVKWASYSNYGMPPVDYIAPGSGICSTYKNGGYASLSGASMA